MTAASESKRAPSTKSAKRASTRAAKPAATAKRPPARAATTKRTPVRKSATKLNSRPPLEPGIAAYNAAQSAGEERICDVLARTIDQQLPGAERKIWHRHPVWFLEGNPIVGYSKLKDCIRLLFWSGQSFDEPGLAPEGSFKAAEARYTAAEQIDAGELKRWLRKSIGIQWDYKNIVKRKGRLERLK